MAGKRLGRVWLTVIAVFKLVKATGLITLGIIALTLAHRDAAHALARWAIFFGLDPDHRLLHETLSKIGGLPPARLQEFGVGTFVYATVFLVEGVGLLLQKRWAEYMTIGVTISFVPLEIYEIVEHTTLPRVAALVVNVAVVAYLIVRVRLERRRDATSPAPAGHGGEPTHTGSSPTLPRPDTSG